MKKLVAAAAVGAALTGCGSSGTSSSTPSTGSANGSTATSSSAGLTGTVTVLAASSLTETFNEFKSELEKANPGLNIKVTYAASSNLVAQLNNGFPADVVALADQKSESQLDKKLVDGKQVHLFATNALEIATPPSNPAKVENIASLNSKSTKTVLCAKEVPCGRAAATVLSKDKVTPNVVSYEQNVKATLAKVVAGDVDAAIVYRTDVKAAGASVHGVVIPDAENTVTTLPIVQLTSTPGAAAFVNLVIGDTGAAQLKAAGFGKP